MIYRKYAHMSARNLLYLQSELHELDEHLRQFDREDAKDIDNKRLSSWPSLLPAS